jgi:hypothetical protein
VLVAPRGLASSRRVYVPEVRHSRDESDRLEPSAAIVIDLREHGDAIALIERTRRSGRQRKSVLTFSASTSTASTPVRNVLGSRVAAGWVKTVLHQRSRHATVANRILMGLLDQTERASDAQLPGLGRRRRRVNLNAPGLHASGAICPALRVQMSGQLCQIETSLLQATLFHMVTGRIACRWRTYGVPLRRTACSGRAHAPGCL